ncbi:MAG: hypothetical protein R6V59_06230 [Dehalococcoidia bacterium]
MPIQDRDYVRGRHPPNCSCAECTSRRLNNMRGGAQENYISNRPSSRRSHLDKRVDNTGGRKAYSHRPHIPNWLKPILLIGALSIVGLIASRFVGSLIPFWLLFGSSIFYSIEKWLGYYTRKYRTVGKIYRLILNLSALSLLGLLVWSGASLFTQQFMQSPLIGSFVFLLEIAVFIWLCRVISKNGWRQPSMKLTVFSLICLFFIFSFAGVQPLSDYKDSLFNSVSSYFRNTDQPETIPSPSSQTYALTIRVSPQGAGSVSPSAGQFESGSRVTVTANPATGYTFDRWSGDASGTSPTIVITIDSNTDVTAYFGEALSNPSWVELKDFLHEDDTDEMEYVYPTTVCFDFAQRLQKNAKTAGWRCAFVEVELEGYPDWYGYGIPSSTGHALNAFETTDKGLVYIDCTAAPGYSGNADKTVDVIVGGQYVPKSIFPEPGWSSTWGNMGTITDVHVHW